MTPFFPIFILPSCSLRFTFCLNRQTLLISIRKMLIHKLCHVTAGKKNQSLTQTKETECSCYKIHLCPNKGESNFFLVSFLFAFPKEDSTFSNSLGKIKGRVLSRTDVHICIPYSFLLDLSFDLPLKSFQWSF